LNRFCFVLILLFDHLDLQAFFDAHVALGTLVSDGSRNVSHRHKVSFWRPASSGCLFFLPSIVFICWSSGTVKMPNLPMERENARRDALRLYLRPLAHCFRVRMSNFVSVEASPVIVRALLEGGHSSLGFLCVFDSVVFFTDRDFSGLPAVCAVMHVKNVVSVCRLVSKELCAAEGAVALSLARGSERWTIVCFPTGVQSAAQLFEAIIITMPNEWNNNIRFICFKKKTSNNKSVSPFIFFKSFSLLLFFSLSLSSLILVGCREHMAVFTPATKIHDYFRRTQLQLKPASFTLYVASHLSQRQ